MKRTWSWLTGRSRPPSLTPRPDPSSCTPARATGIRTAAIRRLLLHARQLIARAYTADERIIYGIGGVIAPDRLADTAADLLERPEVAFVHVRFAATSCFACRVDRARRGDVSNTD